MKLDFDKIYYEKNIFDSPLGKELQEKYKHLEWIEIKTHNRIDEFRASTNADFAKLKKHLIIGTRKTHRYTENHKVSDFLVPYTSSGCSAMCLYCYLVCNYNRYSYLRLFVNREQMLDKILAHDSKSLSPYTYEIGSNSDLVLENMVTNNLVWTIENFVKTAKGKLTFPTKFMQVDSLLNLNHQRKIIFRMSVNPEIIVRKTEFLTSPLTDRITALNRMADAGYEVGILIAPIILIDDYKRHYGELIDTLCDTLSEKVKRTGFIEIILMTYSYVQNEINKDAFLNAIPLLDKMKMQGRGRGKYSYKPEFRLDAETFLIKKLKKLGMKILYIS